MGISELCKDGTRVRLLRENDRLFLQVNAADEPDNSREGVMPCDPDILCSVLRGLTYQLASLTAFCVIRRSGSKVKVEFQAGEGRQECELTAEEFTRIVWPVMPERLRAILL